MEVDVHSAVTKVVLGLVTAVVVGIAGGLYRRLQKYDGNQQKMTVAQARCLVILRATHEIALIVAPPERAEAIQSVVRTMNRDLESLADGKD